MTVTATQNHRLAVTLIVVASTLIFVGLIWMIYFKQNGATGGGNLDFLPAVNATFNSLSAICLLAGFKAIKSGNRIQHKRLMLSALTFSALFLISYVIYHNVHGDTPFPGTGFIRPVYFFILITHIVLSAVVLPMMLTTVFFALTADFRKHPKIARITFPIWLYVSVTGVAIFFLLKAYT